MAYPGQITITTEESTSATNRLNSERAGSTADLEASMKRFKNYTQKTSLAHLDPIIIISMAAGYAKHTVRYFRCPYALNSESLESY
jgi:hypothetical protein